MKNYLIDHAQEIDRLNYQNKIDVYNLNEELNFVRPVKEQFILDAGCGNGNLIEALLLQYGVTKVHGVDLSEDRINQAQKRFSSFNEVKFFTRYLNETQLPENTYDHVICRYIYEHVTNAKDILRELCRVIKPNGKISIINFDDIFFNFYTKNETFNHSLKTLKSKLPQDFEIGRKLPQYLSQCGFNNVQWDAQSYFFQGERMGMEIENTRMRLEQGREHLGRYFDSLDEYDFFAKTYLEEMRDPNNILSVTKFLINANKCVPGKVLKLKD